MEKWVSPTTGQSTGRIKHPDSLLRAVENLVKRSQVDAVAVVGRFPDDEVDDLDDYRLGIVRHLFLFLDFVSKMPRIYYVTISKVFYTCMEKVKVSYDNFLC